MFNSLLQTITQTISDYPAWSGGIVFSVAMLESLAVIGLVIPGVAIMFTIGALIGSGSLNFVSSTLYAAAGASVGDALSFALGWHYKEKIVHLTFLKPHQNLLKKGHVFFEKYGVYSILIGRFIGPVRAIVPLVAGILGMPIKQYIPINILASMLWAPAYLLPGFLLTSAIYSLPKEWVAFWPLSLIPLFMIVLLAIQLRKIKKD